MLPFSFTGSALRILGRAAVARDQEVRHQVVFEHLLWMFHGKAFAGAFAASNLL